MVHPKKLLVEGDTDKRVIPYLMEANGVEWGPRNNPAVFIEPYGGMDELLKRNVIENELKVARLEALGVLFDANGDAQQRWNQIRIRYRDEFDNLPAEMPAAGLNLGHALGPRFGIWIMPDNQFFGMLEDFLAQLIPDDLRGLYEIAGTCVAEAKRNGAPFKDVHRTKAEIHTWLAWQDEPGKQLHQAVHHRVLDPKKPESQAFVNWFRRLFDV